MIYFTRDEVTKLVKIGFTARDGEDRLRDFQTGCPGQLVLLLQIEGSKQDEAAWHERFAEARERGEWFQPVPELLLAITEAKVSQLEAENAQLQATLDAERDRVREARGILGQVWALMGGEPVPLTGDISPSANATHLEAENARLQAKLDAERDSRKSFMFAINTVCRMLEGPAVLPESEQADS